MVKLFFRNWAERWRQKIKTPRKLSRFSCYQQDLLKGNTVCIRATTLALISSATTGGLSLALARVPGTVLEEPVLHGSEASLGHQFPALPKQALEYCSLL